MGSEARTEPAAARALGGADIFVDQAVETAETVSSRNGQVRTRVFLRRIKIDGFLSFGQPAELNLGPGLTVVTGPNAAGKSNIGRCLDVARAVLAAHDDPEAERLDLYRDA